MVEGCEFAKLSDIDLTQTFRTPGPFRPEPPASDEVRLLEQ